MIVDLTPPLPQNFGGGAQADSDQVWAFYTTVIPWLMSQDYVEAFFPFGERYALLSQSRQSDEAS